MGENMAWETGDEEWAGETMDEAPGGTADEFSRGFRVAETADEFPRGMGMGETADEFSRGFGMGETADELPYGFGMGETADEFPRGFGVAETVDAATDDASASVDAQAGKGALPHLAFRSGSGKNNSSAIRSGSGKNNSSAVRFSPGKNNSSAVRPTPGKNSGHAVRAGQRIEGRHIKMLVRELLPYMILAACMGIMVGGALSFKRAQVERLGQEALREYEEQFLHE